MYLCANLPSDSAEQLIDRDMKYVRKGNELRRLGEGLARLPLGNGAVGDAEAVRQLLLRHSLSSPKRIEVISEFVHACLLFLSFYRRNGAKSRLTASIVLPYSEISLPHSGKTAAPSRDGRSFL